MQQSHKSQTVKCVTMTDTTSSTEYLQNRKIFKIAKKKDLPLVLSDISHIKVRVAVICVAFLVTVRIESGFPIFCPVSFVLRVMVCFTWCGVYTRLPLLGCLLIDTFSRCVLVQERSNLFVPCFLCMSCFAPFRLSFFGLLCVCVCVCACVFNGCIDGHDCKDQKCGL